MSNPAVRNLAVMLAAMTYIKNLDQEDPQVIMYVRLGYGVYLLLGLLLNLVLYRIITRRADRRVIRVPRRPPSPFAPPPPSPPDEAGAAGEPEPERQTVMEYDLGVLASARFAVLSNAVVLGLLHYKMRTLSPMIMSAVMGVMRLLDDPLVHLHLLGRPAVGKLRRPFQPEKNPLAAMLQQMAPTPPDGAAPQGSAQSRPGRTGRAAARDEDEGEGEELAGSSEEEEEENSALSPVEPEGDKELEGEIDLRTDGESKKTR